ncbi:hypothetical protein OGAPHI_005014 [Ogataea philodendri]|uniref:Uncharacterized protein n=1 Tax=Ogataea philodendri TaxID=1378263 RepID=A0A9P8P128_9ASCO|nr:uncharacterized protein OGAPHI_005014 [Ogataea philodendri]KAH3663613.1 hypothetical protein OGAPHI_005014 [Ogataea philodendri]
MKSLIGEVLTIRIFKMVLMFNTLVPMFFEKLDDEVILIGSGDNVGRSSRNVFSDCRSNTSCSAMISVIGLSFTVLSQNSLKTSSTSLSR